MKQVILTEGDITAVDDNLFVLINEHNWRKNGKGYAYKIREYKALFLHNFVFELLCIPVPDGFELDHWNRDKLDNQFANLRIVTNAHNQYNRGLRKDNSSGFRGVSWYETKSKWRTQIKHRGTVLHLGYFQSLEEAIEARLRAESRFGIKVYQGGKDGH